MALTVHALPELGSKRKRVKLVERPFPLASRPCSARMNMWDRFRVNGSVSGRTALPRVLAMFASGSVTLVDVRGICTH